MYSKNSIKLNVIINNVYYVPTVKSTNECVVIIKKYLYCIYVIMYSKKRKCKYCKKLSCDVLIYLRGNSIGTDNDDDNDNNNTL